MLYQDWAMSLCLQNLGIIKEDDEFAAATSMASTSRSSRSGTRMPVIKEHTLAALVATLTD